MHRLHRLKMGLLPHRIFWGEVTLSLFFSLMIFLPTTTAVDVVRFQNRSLTLDSTLPGVTTNYTLRMTFATPTTTGSVDMLFCIDPIPYLPCDVPTGLDVSGAQLVSQQGETGWTLDVLSSNHLRLTRPPDVIGNTPSEFVFSGIVNPTYMEHSYAIRMHSYPTSDGSGPIIDVGAVTTMITEAVMIYSQVPPQLVLCVGQAVTESCSETIGGNYSDLGMLDPEDTLSAMSQVAVGTNATNGFVLTVHGRPPTAGNRVFPAPLVPTLSQKGITQFGINLTQNTIPAVGNDPDGQDNIAVASADYSQPNYFLFRDGDVIAAAPDVSLMSRFTISYILNTAEDLKAGVYTTTLTYIGMGRF